MRAVGVLTLLATVAVLGGCATTKPAARQIIATPNAPAAIGPYSQAIFANGVLYVSGQIGLDPKSGVLAAPDIRGQTTQVMKNLSAVLAAAGMTLDDAVQTQVYLSNLDDFAIMNELYGTYFKSPPARATVQVARLPRDARIEIALIAVKNAKP